jgi:hypothetical protein
MRLLFMGVASGWREVLAHKLRSFLTLLASCSAPPHWLACSASSGAASRLGADDLRDWRH